MPRNRSIDALPDDDVVTGFQHHFAGRALETLVKGSKVSGYVAGKVVNGAAGTAWAIGRGVLGK